MVVKRELTADKSVNKIQQLFTRKSTAGRDVLCANMPVGSVGANLLNFAQKLSKVWQKASQRDLRVAPDNRHRNSLIRGRAGKLSLGDGE